MRIEKSIFKYIEHELYNYEYTKKELELHKEQILESTGKPEVAVQSQPGDTTANKAIKLTSSPSIIHSEKMINAIDTSLKILGENHQTLFKLKYIDCRPAREIMLLMNIGRSSYFNIRREIVIAVGQKIGIINI